MTPSTVRPLDASAMAAARERHASLTKPRGSLGRLEDLGVLLAGVTGRCPPPVPTHPAVAVFAADHGVVAEGVSAWPQEVTAQMVANIAAGGAAISVLAAGIGARLHVVDVGVATPLPPDLPIDRRPIGRGTADLAVVPAMSRAEAERSIEVGSAVADLLGADGADLLVAGEMGIGNTTAATAIVAACTGTDPAALVGPGAGADEATRSRKREVVATAIARVGRDADPLTVLAEVGGFEIGALAGFTIAAATRATPIVVDGLISLAAVLVADGLAPGTAARCVAGHRSAEPAASVALDHLGLVPLLDLDLRLGEGSGACLAVPLVVAAAEILGGMATFTDAGVG